MSITLFFLKEREGTEKDVALLLSAPRGSPMFHGEPECLQFVTCPVPLPQEAHPTSKRTLPEPPHRPWGGEAAVSSQNQTCCTPKTWGKGLSTGGGGRKVMCIISLLSAQTLWLAVLANSKGGRRFAFT